VVRRHPDVKWLRRESDIAQFAGQQARMLTRCGRAWPAVGSFSMRPARSSTPENERQIAAFTPAPSEALRESLTFASGIAHCGAQLLPSSGAAGHNQDGFFYALLRKP
jgi:16S rRNA (cytosine967-C5)-methyltransferase